MNERRLVVKGGRVKYFLVRSPQASAAGANVSRLGMVVRNATSWRDEMDPETVLREVLGRIAEHPINRIDELLPWNIALGEELRQAA